MEQINIKFNQKLIKVFCRDEVDRSVLNEIFKFKEYRSAAKIITAAEYPILDVGAHAGFFSLYAAVLNLKVKIYALEPEEKNFSLLEQHIKINNLTNIIPVKAALAAVSGQRRLLITEDHINHRLVLPQEEVEEHQTVEVACWSLADFLSEFKISKLALIKMDIEGGEHELVKSWQSADYQNIGAIMVEYHTQYLNQQKDLEKTLRVNGFGVQNFPSKFDTDLGFFLATNKRSRI